MYPPPRSKSVHWFSTSGQIRTCCEPALPPRFEMACPRVACTVNYWIWKKQHNCRQWCPHVLPVLHPLQNYTVGWGKVNQHNAESCCLYFACQTANKHKWFFNDRPLYPTKLSTHKQAFLHAYTPCTLRIFAPTHIHNEFYQGKYMRFNGSLQMPVPLSLLCSSSNKMLSSPPVSLIFWKHGKERKNILSNDAFCRCKKLDFLFRWGPMLYFHQVMGLSWEDSVCVVLSGV